MLTTVKNVQSYLNINNDDEFIKQLIKYAQATIEGYCKRKFESQEYVEEVHIVKNKIFTKQYPISEISEILINDNKIENYRLLPTHVMLSNKVLTMTGGYGFAETSEKLAIITYTAGYEAFDIPQDLVFACTKLTAYYYKEAREDRLGVEQEKMDVMTTVYQTAIPSSITLLLNPYKKVTF